MHLPVSRLALMPDTAAAETVFSPCLIPHPAKAQSLPETAALHESSDAVPYKIPKDMTMQTLSASLPAPP